MSQRLQHDSGHRPGNLSRDLSGTLSGSSLELEIEPAVFEPAGDEHFMALALEQARRAARADEVPVGAVVVVDGKVVAAEHNRVNELADPTAHAERLAIARAAALSGYPRLTGATVYTTVEPCFMCAGALSQARVERVVWAVRDPKFGGCASLGRVLDDPRLNHSASITEGVGADESAELLRSFFRTKRDARRGT